MKPLDFFIVGAPKCATTSLATYLSQHPGVFLPRGEMNFFSDATTHRIPTLEEYRRYFAEAKYEQVRGEKSVTYLFSEESPARLRRLNPDARIIIVLRNPVDMMFSLHRQALFTGNEDLLKFEDALAAEADRRVGRRIPKAAHNPRFLQYRAVATFSPQVARYFETFGRANVHVILFDDLKADPARVYRDTLAFLGVDPSFEPEFVVHNAAKLVPNIRLRSFMKLHPEVTRAIRAVVSRHGIAAIRSLLVRSQPQPPRKPDPRLRVKLLREFASEIDALASMLGRDLSHWHA